MLSHELIHHLCYVAATRAREALYILNYSQKPEAKDKAVRVKASMFLKEIKDRSPIKTLKNQEFDKKRQMQIKDMNSEFAEGDIRRFRIGMPVHHRIFGSGIVISRTLFFINICFEIGNKIFSLK